MSYVEKKSITGLPHPLLTESELVFLNSYVIIAHIN